MTHRRGQKGAIIETFWLTSFKVLLPDLTFGSSVVATESIMKISDILWKFIIKISVLQAKTERESVNGYRMGWRDGEPFDRLTPLFGVDG